MINGKRILRVSFGVMLLALVPLNTGAKDVERLHSGVVEVRAGFDEGDEKLQWRSGAGFLVRSDRGGHYILSLARFVKGAERIEVRYYYRRDRSREAKVVHMEGRGANGIALLFVRERPPVGTMAFAFKTDPRPGESVRVAGFAPGGRGRRMSAGKVGAVAPGLTFLAKIGDTPAGVPVLAADGRALGIVVATNAKGGTALGARVLQSRFDRWEFDSFQPPVPKPGTVSFPQSWSRTFPDFRPVHIMAGDSGYLLFGQFSEGETPDGKPNWRSAVLRLDADLQPVARENFHAKSPGSSQIVRVVSMPNGGIFVQEQVDVLVAPDVRNLFVDLRIVQLDASGALPGREVFKENINPNLKHEIFQADSDLIGLDDRTYITYFNSTTGGRTDKLLSRANRFVFVPNSQGELLCITTSFQPRAKYLTRRTLKGETLKQYQFDLEADSGWPKFVPNANGQVLMAFHHKLPRALRGKGNAYIAKFDADLKPLWRRLVLENYSRKIRGLWLFKSGGMLLALEGFFSDVGRVSLLMYLDSRGQERWRQVYVIQGFGTRDVRFTSMLELADGSFLLAGEHGAYFEKDAAGDGFIWRLDQKGRFLPTPGASRRHARK